VLVIILYFTWSAGELEFRVADPCYALISRHGEDITFWAYVVAGVVIVTSLIMMLPFCRWFCPLAAVLNPFSRIGVGRVKRDSEACVNCGLCSKVCPTAIPVERIPEVKAARCLSCLQCVEVCPRISDGALFWGPPKRFGKSWSQGVLISVLLVCFAGAVTAAYAIPLPSYIKVFEDRDAEPADAASVELAIGELGCRGKASLLVYFLDRDDYYAVPGYLKLEAWPAPHQGRARILFDPAQADEASIKQAITEPYFDGQEWWPSPFIIEGYDMLEDAVEIDSL